MGCQMETVEKMQGVFSEFCVPDRGRILKVKKWLEKQKYLSLDHEMSVLEIGYARGGLIDNLHEYKGIKKYAIDINERQPENGIIFCRHNCNDGIPDFNGLRFDVVFAGEMIEHIYDDRRFLIDIFEILKPAGILALTTPNLFFLPNRFLFPFGKTPYFACEPYHYHFYDGTLLSDIVRNTGFEIQYITSSHVLVSTRRNRYLGRICEMLGDIAPNFGAHIILFAKKPEKV